MKILYTLNRIEIIFLFMCMGASHCFSQQLHLDNSFGQGGKASKAFINEEAQVSSLAIQNNGKILLGGYNGIYPLYNSTLVRFNANGELDSTYGINGIAVHNIALGPDRGFSDIAVQPDDKIVAVGTETIARFSPDGHLDSTFGSSGTQTTSELVMNSVAVQSDGKIIAAGLKWTWPNNYFALLRWTQFGLVDSSFGLNGLVTTVINGTQTSKIEAIAIQPDGKIIAVGICNPGTGAIVRYNSNGRIDSSFGLLGIAQNFWNTGSGPTSVCLQEDGKILVTGNGQKALRLNSNGTVDSTFGINGVIKIAEGFSHAKDITVDAFKRIVLAGDTGNGTEKDFLVALFDSTGVKLDSILTDFIGYEEAQATYIQNDNKIVVAGFNWSGLTNGNPVFALARYEYSVELGFEWIKNESVTLSPNPATTTLTLQSESNLPAQTSFRLFDVIGRMVLEQEVSDRTERIDVRALSKGMYLYSVDSGGEKMGAGKVVVE